MRAGSGLVYALLGVAVLALGCEAQVFGPEASAVQATCPFDSFYAENFYQGANVVGVVEVQTVSACCRTCSDDAECTKWTYCDMSQADGCIVPLGPLMNTTYPGGTCLLSSSALPAGAGAAATSAAALPAGASSAPAMWLTWSHMQTGVQWVSGEYAGNVTAVMESADVVKESYEKLGFSSADTMFCRVVATGSLQLMTLNDTLTAGPTVAAGEQVGYGGLIVTDADGAAWAIVHLNSSGSFWLYPAEHLTACSAPYPGCTPNPVAQEGGVYGTTEEGASCWDDSDCCDGLVCKPRGVAYAQVAYKAASYVAQSPQFATDPSLPLPLLPNECARALDGSAPGAGPRYDAPRYGAAALDWCRDDQGSCGEAAAQYYCELKGYGGVADYAGPVQVTIGTTVLPQLQLTCSPDFNTCQTFIYIVCG